MQTLLNTSAALAKVLRPGAVRLSVASFFGLVLLAMPLAVSAQPVISTQPTNVVVCSGGAASFTVVATGIEPLTYQWYLEAGILTGETAATLNIASAQPANAGGYTVVVTDSSGSVTSVVATLTVNATPTVTVDSAAICPGGSATLTATTSAASPTYSWSSGETTASITVSPAATTTYTVTVTDGVTGCSASGSGTVTVNVATTATGPANQGVCVGAPVTFTTVPAGTGPFHYFWYLPDGTPLPFDSPTLSLTAASSADAGIYTVEVTGACGSVTNTATLTVNPPPTVTVNSETICPGGSVVLTATTDAINPTYLWSNGDTNASITVSPAATTTYTVTVDVAGCSGTGSGTVTVREATTALGPANIADACPGTPVTFSTVASGDGPFTYTWLKGTNVIDGPGANSSYTIPSVSSADADTYAVIVQGTCNSVTNSATLTVAVAPAITAQPQNAFTPMGNTATFSVTVTGPNLSYQWQANGTDIAGATLPSYTTPVLGLSDSGTTTYRVFVSNCAGSLTSAGVTATVTPLFGLSFDFNTPNQFTNVMSSLTVNDWLGNNVPALILESATGGAGGSGGLDVTGTADSSSLLLPTSFDFSQSNKTLVASVMVKMAAPSQNNRATQLGFVTSTNIGINDTTPQGFMTVILQSTAQPALTYQLRLQHRRTDGGIAEATPVSTTATLTAGNWYKLVAIFANTKGGAADMTVAASLQDMGANGATPGAVVLSYSPYNVTNPNLVTQKYMYLAIRTSRSDTGADYWDNIFAANASGPVSFSVPPASQTVLQGRQATFKAMVDGSGPYTYQWYKNGTAITGAQNWKYITPPVTLADNGAQYTVTVTTTNNTANSADIAGSGVLTVQADALVVVSVGSVNGNLVGLRFNQAVDKASAETAGNYLINGASAIKAVLMPDAQSVLLTSPALLTDGFTVAAQNVLDLSGGTVGSPNSASGTVANLYSLDIGQATTVVQPVGTTYSFAPNSFEITAGGVDIWNLSDAFRYVYTQKTGDFDVKMRVPYMDITATPAKAGLMARASLEPTSPMVAASPNPKWPGRQYYEGSRRTDYNVGASSWGTTTACSFPDTWLRFRRVANTFSRYSSRDGVNWLLDGQTSVILPNTVYFGMAVCSVRNGYPLSVKIDNYGDFPGYPGATITITTQAVSSVTVAAGGTTNLSVSASVTGAAATELAYVWQRSDGSGGWINLPSAGINNGNITAGPFLATDNGAQLRCVVSLLGAASVISDPVTVTVEDTVAPTLSSAAVPALANYQIVLTFSEALGDSALNTANYVVTNAAGADMGVAGVAFLGTDRKTVVVTTTSLLTIGGYGVYVSNVQDLGGNVITPVTKTFSQAATAPAQPIVVEYYEGLPNPSTQSITDLVNSVKFINNHPDSIGYSNVFGINAIAANLPDSGLNHYGARLYTYYVAPSSGTFKFYLRSDDFSVFFMNTNAVDSTLGRDIVIPSSFNCPVNEQANWAIDNNPATKYLNNDKANSGFIVTPAMGSSTVTGMRFTSANDGPERDPMTFTLEGANSPSGPWTLIASGDTGLSTTRLAQAAPVTFANAAAYTSYRVIFPTLRNTPSAATCMQIGDVELLDAAGRDVTGRGATRQIALTGANSAYASGNSATVTLTAGQKYYLEAWLKEGTGGDGISVAARTDSTVPGQGEVIPVSQCAYPADKAPFTPAVAEIYTVYPTPYGNVGLFNSALVDLTNAMNTTFYLQHLPYWLGYEKDFSFNTNQVDVPSAFNNYLGRLYAYFIPPSNGLYRFYIASDDCSVLNMNTNAVNSTDPAGKATLISLATYNNSYSAAAMAQNVPLVGGQKYYLEALWKEASGGDGVKVAFRAQSDAAVPPMAEVIPGSMLDFPATLDRVGAVTVAGITPVNPTVSVGSTITFSAVNICGAQPYFYTWLKNGQPVYYGTPYANTPLFTTQPLLPSDNGAVFTLVVSNLFSRAEQSTTVTVTPGAPPALVSVVGSQYGNSVTLSFSGVVDPFTAQSVGSYSIPGLSIFSATPNLSGTKVVLQTTAQTPNTGYTITASLRDITGTPFSATTNFTSWGIGGSAVLVELFTNINGGAVANLTGDPKFIANAPDVSGFVTRFGYDSRSGQNLAASLSGFGPFAGNGLEYYGARLSAYFIAPSNGNFQFFIRSDDTSQLFINTNNAGSMDPAGKVMVAQSTGANQDWTNTLSCRSAFLPMNAGQLYYMEALLKEGTGGDYVRVAFREQNDPIIPDGNNANIPASFFTTAGNPDVNKMVISQSPPAEIWATENDDISLAIIAIPTPANLPFSYTWQKYDSVAAAFINIPGANASFLPTFRATLGDDGAQYRVVIAIPGTVQSFTTLLHVTTDVTPPQILSAGSLDGATVGVLYSEPVDITFATDIYNYEFNGDPSSYLVTNVVLMPDQRTALVQLDTTSGWPLPGDTFSLFMWEIHDLAAFSNVTAQVTVDGRIEHLTAMDIGTPGTSAAGNINPFLPGSSMAVSNGYFNVWANGYDIWNALDGFHFIERQVSGNFDVKVRVNKLLGADQWSKAGLMARGTTNQNSRFMFMAVTPPVSPIGSQAPVNQYSLQSRFVDGGGTAGVNLTNWNSTVAPPYPDAWVRLQRLGSVFNAYWSSNGVDWVLHRSVDTATLLGGAFPGTMYLGLATSSHDQTRGLANNAYAEYRDLYFPMAPTIIVQPDPVDQTVGIHANVSYTVTGDNPPDSGEMVYQWYRNGIMIPNATNATLALNNLNVVDSGVYTVAVGNDGGGVLSVPVTLTVSNALPVVIADTVTLLENTGATLAAADLLANDSDPEGDPLSIIAVSGVLPVTFATDFNAGLPVGSAVYGSARADAIDGVAGSGCLKINDAVGSVSGSYIIDELTPGKRVSSFTASFKLRIGNGSGEPADGFSFNFGNDLPNAATGSRAAEEGISGVLSVSLDNYRFAPYPAGGTANTSGMKLRYGGVDIAGVQIPTWNSTNYVPVSITLAPNGTLTVLVDGTNVFGNVVLPYVPAAGRFGFFARTGGQFETHWLDDLSITVLTVETAHGYAIGGNIYGSASITQTGGVNDSGVLHLTDSANNQAGSFVINQLTPDAVQSFNASFKVRIGDGSANGADGMSFNLASDLLNGPSGGAEEGVGSGLAVCIKNYPAAGPGAPAIKVKYAGTELGLVMIPKWNNTNYIPININLDPDGTLDVVVDGTNVFANLQTPYQPVTGRFGFYARTGGEKETHWVDDLTISVATVGGNTRTYTQDFNNAGGAGTVTLNAGVITYTPPVNACGSDTFYYLVSDGQVGGAVWDSVTVQLNEPTPEAPVITSCSPPVTVGTVTNCQGAVPDLTGYVSAADNCSISAITQDPPAGTLVDLGDTTVTLTVTDGMGLTATCQTTVTVVDQTPPVVTVPADITVECAGPLGNTVEFLVEAVDNCTTARVTCDPPLGSSFLAGTTVVTCTAVDLVGNTNTGSFRVIVADTVKPVITLAGMPLMPVECHTPFVDPGATADDSCAGSVPVVVSGDVVNPDLPGTYVIHYNAMDPAGNVADEVIRTVIVGDTTPPTVVCPANIVTNMTGTNLPVVTFAATAADLCDPLVQVTCTPESGTAFPIGTNTVICVARDGSGNTNSCSFTVTVEQPTPPTLSIALVNGEVVISWPQTAVEYELKQCSGLEDPVTWETSPATVTLADGIYQARITSPTGKMFYRLVSK